MSDTKQKEIWMVFPEIPFIEVSNLGRVRTVDRTVTRGDGTKQFFKSKILKQQQVRGGYMQIRISVCGKKINLYVHRAAATCFIPNPDNLSEINHKDNNPQNNAASNLEWCTRQYNVVYREKYGKSAAKIFGHPVFAVNLKTGKVLRFESQREAGRQLGIHHSSISKVIEGKLNAVGD